MRVRPSSALAITLAPIARLHCTLADQIPQWLTEASTRHPPAVRQRSSASPSLLRYNNWNVEPEVRCNGRDTGMYLRPGIILSLGRRSIIGKPSVLLTTFISARICAQIDIGSGFRGTRKTLSASIRQEELGRRHGCANSIKTSVKRSSVRPRGWKAHRLIGCDRSGKLHRC